MDTVTKNRFDYVDVKESQDIANACKWVLSKNWKNRDTSDDGASHFIESMYSGVQSFGCTDYKDHRGDSLETLKRLIINHVAGKYTHQRLHYYSDKECLVPYKTIIVQGYNGGYFGKFA